MTTVNYTYLFQNPDLPLETRVNDLISHLTLEEKINLMCQYQDGVNRLGIKPYKHGTEAAHGIAWLGEATTFPQPIGLACTWDNELLHRVGSIISDEARGFYSKNPAVHGLTLWTPTVDMERDPRWGRTEEAYGEDPYLTGKLASSLIQGIQGTDPFYLKAAATLKHFIGNNNEINRGECSVSIDPRNMHEYYLKAFERPFVEGGAQSMMTAYNSVNGVPANLNPDVMKIVKQQWGMNGFVVSDAGDVLGTVNDHKYYDYYKEAVAYTIKSGVDSITDDHAITKQAFRESLDEGLLQENELDVALRNTFRVRFRLGEFDPDERNPYAGITESIICRPAHSKASLQAARKNIVLLKNDKQILPLRAEKLNKIAVIGPLANIVYRDWYSGTLPYAVTPLQGITHKLSDKHIIFRDGCDHIKLKAVTANKYIKLSGEEQLLCANQINADQAALFELTDWGWGSHTLKSLDNYKYVTTDDKQITASSDDIWGWFTKEVLYMEAKEHDNVSLKTWNQQSTTAMNDDFASLSVTDKTNTHAAETFQKEVVVDGLQEAVKAAKNSDTAIVFVGNHPLINGKETMDRPDITLPESQERLIQEVYKANPNTIVVLVGSYPYAINWVDNNIPAVLFTSHAGQELGNAIADVLFGDYNPAGRLNMTWYRSAQQLPDFMDYDIIKGERTYQYFKGDVLYPFGHGLTYAKFKYSNLNLSMETAASTDQITVSVEVKNTSSIDSDEVVQLYVRAGASRVKRPIKQLQGFRRLHLAPHHSEVVQFTLKVSELAHWDVTRDQFCVESGIYTIMIGKSSADIQLSKELIVKGETIPPRNLMKVTRTANYDDYLGVQLAECIEGGSSITVMHVGDWVCFNDVNMGDGVNFFEVRAASIQGGSIEIRLDHVDGPLAGICPVSPTGGMQSWSTETCSITEASGNHDVYLKFTNNVNISWFRFII